MNNKITVVKWLTYEESEEYEESLGEMGGWVHGERWREYVSSYSSKILPYFEAIKEKILEDKLRIGGDEHQKAFVPLFSDNTVASFSFRGWGDLMAAIYNEHENTNEYCYMDFYMTDFKLPEKEEIEEQGE